MSALGFTFAPSAAGLVFAAVLRVALFGLVHLVVFVVFVFLVFVP